MAQIKAQDREGALQSFSKDIYFHSLELGPKHVRTAPGYFLLAEVFLKTEQIQQGLKYIEQFVEILGANADIKQFLNQVELTEYRRMLENSLQHAKSLAGEQHLITANALIALGLFDKSVQQTTQAQSEFKSAYNILSLQVGPKHPKSLELKKLLKET